jgi:hypothetical protein
MFEVGEWSLQLIIRQLNVLKNDLGEVYEAMFQGFERPCELIFCILVIKINDIDEVA